MKGEGAYGINIPIVDLCGEEIAIGIQCDAGKILTRTGSRAQIGICGFSGKQITEQTKNGEFQQGVTISWVGNTSPRVPTSSFAGEIQAVFYGFDMARMLKGLTAELLFGNLGAEIPTYVGNDNSASVYQVDSVNTVTNKKRLNNFLGGNREELENTERLSIGYIPGGMNTSDGLIKSMTGLN